MKDADGNVIATKDKDGNWRDTEGNIIQKVDDSNIEDAIYVKDVPKGSTMSDLNGSTVKDTPENNSRINNAANEEISDGGIKEVETNSEVGNLQDQTKKLEREIDELRKDLSNTKDKLSAEQIKTRDDKIKELNDKLEDLKNKPTETKSSGVDVNITEKQTDYTSEKLVKELGWSKKFSNWFVNYLLPLKITGEENGFIRYAKRAGSATVDPLGIINWFRDYKPRLPKGVHMEKKTIKWRKIYRTIGGS